MSSKHVNTASRITLSIIAGLTIYGYVSFYENPTGLRIAIDIITIVIVGWLSFVRED